MAFGILYTLTATATALPAAGATDGHGYARADRAATTACGGGRRAPVGRIGDTVGGQSGHRSGQRVKRPKRHKSSVSQERPP